jgi:hypothetical protein
MCERTSGNLEIPGSRKRAPRNDGILPYRAKRFFNEACGFSGHIKPLPTVTVRSMVCHKIDQPKFTQS